MVTTAFTLLCSAQIVHFLNHWLLLSRRLYAEHRESRLRGHLDWHGEQHRPGTSASAYRVFSSDI